MLGSRSGPGSGSQQHAKNWKKILAIGLTTRICLRERACDKNYARFFNDFNSSEDYTTSMLDEPILSKEHRWNDIYREQP
jgi:hypothetical protein